MDERNKIIKRVSFWGIFVNFILIVIKFIAGIFSRSNALIADSMHSVEDMLSSILSFIGASIASKKPSLKYSLGYGKAEYIFSLLISIFMIVTSITLLVNLIEGIISKDFIQFSFLSILVCLITIVIKTVLCIYTKIKYKKTHSILIKASYEDHRNDIWITIATLISVIFSYFGVYFIDVILAILIVIWIGKTGVKIFLSAFEILMDKNISKDEELDIKSEILSNEDILSVEKIISKPIGDKYILIIILCINNYNDIDFVEEIINRIKKQIIYKFSNISNVFIEIKKNKCIDI